MNKAKWLLELLFKALGLHDNTKKLLLVFALLTVIQLPYSIPGLWKTGWGIYFSWKNNLPPSSVVSSPSPAPSTTGPLADTTTTGSGAGGSRTRHGRPH